MSTDSTFKCYHISNYHIGKKGAQYEKDRSVEDRLQSLKDYFQKFGMKRTVEGVCMAFQHRHPVILLLKIGNSDKGFFKLPGGKLNPDEDFQTGLRRKMIKRLSPNKEEFPDQFHEWEIGPCIGSWYRPNFTTCFYPYCPPHITKPKELKKLYLINLPPKTHFQVPENFHFVAVPLFELYDNSRTYGAIISSIPQMISSLSIQYMKVPSTITPKTETKPESK